MPFSSAILFAQRANPPNDGDVETGLAILGGLSLATALGLACFGLFALLLYFLPVMVAYGRDHQNTAAIAALTMLLGWTFLGWCGALVWSLTAVEPSGRSRAARRRVRYEDDDGPEPPRTGGRGDFDFS